MNNELNDGRNVGSRTGEESGSKTEAKEKAVELAKRLKREGVVLDIIMKSTGMSKKEAEELFLRDD